MDAAFSFPPPRQQQQQQPSSRHLQTLSPERVNSARTISTTSTLTSKSTASRTVSTESQYHAAPASPFSQSSPTRHNKANLFADYHPTTGTSPPKPSSFALAQSSPSLQPDVHALKAAHVRTNSDVQGLVKRFEHLDVRDRDAESAERRRKHEAELRRAQMAREEAESDVRRLREEVRRYKRDMEEGRDRERRVGKRLEVVMEEFGTAKETYASQASVYEKEVRRARKEAFKSSSVVVKLQEELKSTRNSLRITHSGLDMEKQKVQRREQETFNAQYQLVAVQEELDKFKARLKAVEEEGAALKTSLKEEEIARIAAEGLIALPRGKDDDEFGSPLRQRSPHKRNVSPLSDDKENIDVGSKKAVQTKQMEAQLARERRSREAAEQMVEFLSLECTFRCCRCQRSASQPLEASLKLDGPLAEAIQVLRDDVRSILLPPSQTEGLDRMQADTTHGAAADIFVPTSSMDSATFSPQAWGELDRPTQEEPRVSEDVFETAIEQDEATVLQETEAINAQDSEPEPTGAPTPETEPLIEEDPQPSDTAIITDEPTPTSLTKTIPIQPSSPSTTPDPHPSTPFRHQPSIRTYTTTTTIPMHFTPVAKPTQLIDFVSDAENIPPPSLQADPSNTTAASTATTPTFDRAAALAAIEYRRGRAKSIAEGHATPRKQMLEGVGLKERRDISAPALGGKTLGGGASGSYAKGATSVGRSVGRKMVA